MRLRKRKGTEIKIEITFDKKTKDMNVFVKPEETRPTEIIQVLLLAVNVINEAIKPDLRELQKEELKKIKLPYVG